MGADSTASPDGEVRDDGGQYAPRYGEGDFLAAVAEHAPAATQEVADTVGCARQNADRRLRALEDDGKVRSKKVGPALVWMIIEDGETT